MSEPGPLPAGYADQRVLVQRVATHVLARARSQAVGRIGLVATADGIGTPAFGPEATVVRLTPTALVVERGGDATWTPLGGATLRTLAAAAGADLAADLDVGTDAVPLDDPDRPLALQPASIEAVAGWLGFGAAVLDAIAADDPARPTTRPQLWPEHFDLAVTVTNGAGDLDRANVGASPGDGSSAQPYLYVGPWGADRPGDPGEWDAPFGATLGHDRLRAEADPLATAVGFVRRRLGLLA